jgi:hypothetical protein
MEPDVVLNPEAAQALQTFASRGGDLLMWVITYHPLDYPSHVAARPHRTIPKAGALPMVLLADTVEEMRERLPAGLTRMTRALADDPCIVEVWF